MSDFRCPETKEEGYDCGYCETMALNQGCKKIFSCFVYKYNKKKEEEE